MNDLQEIEENYKAMSTTKLKTLAQKPQDLRIEVLPLLQQELLARGENTDAMSITQYLVQAKQANPTANLSSDDLKQLIKDRLSAGESLESITTDNQGINIFTIIDNDNKLKEKAFSYISSLKDQGLHDEELDAKLRETLTITQTQLDMLKAELKARAHKNLVMGYVIVGVALLLILISMLAGGNVTIGAVLIFIIGVVKLIQGYEQGRK